MADLARLLDDYAARLARGERPDPRAYVARAGAAGEELRELIDALLRAAPVRSAGEEEVAVMAAWAAGRPPLAELRRRRGGRVEAIVDDIVAALGIDPARRAAVVHHYRRLEAGLVDLRRVDRRVLEAIAAAIGSSIAELRAWGARLGAAAAPAAASRALMAEASLAPRGPGEPPDEIARLFGEG